MFNRCLYYNFSELFCQGFFIKNCWRAWVGERRGQQSIKFGRRPPWLRACGPLRNVTLKDWGTTTITVIATTPPSGEKSKIVVQNLRRFQRLRLVRLGIDRVLPISRGTSHYNPTILRKKAKFPKKFSEPKKKQFHLPQQPKTWRFAARIAPKKVRGRNLKIQLSNIGNKGFHSSG